MCKERCVLRPLIALVLLVVLCGQSQAQGRKPALSDEQRKELTSLITEFRRVRAQPQKRLEVIDRMADLGPIGLANLLEVINKELGTRLADYRQAFGKAAAAIVARRTEPANLQEIARLRTEVLALSQNDALTKEQIRDVGDPAVAQLKKLILVSPQEILAKNPDLGKRRDALGTLGSQWERCTTLLLYAQFEEDQKREEAKRKAEEKGAGDRPIDLPPPPTAVDAFTQAEPGQAEPAPAEQAQPDDSDVIGAPSFAAYLAKEEEIAVALATPMDPQTRAVLAFNNQLAGRLDPEEARCVLDLNLTRNLLGLPAVKIDLALAAAARDHSKDMATLGFFAHESPVPGKTGPDDRAKLFGTTASAENIAMGTLDGAVVNQMWWHSPGHHKNMLGDHTRVGLGRHERYWTELFGR
jgi:uncharacterized protein YkwD